MELNNQVAPLDAEVEVDNGELSVHSLTRMDLRSQQRLMTHLKQLIDEAKDGDKVSHNIMGHISRKTFKRMGIEAEEGSEEQSERDGEENGSEVNDEKEISKTQKPLPAVRRRSRQMTPNVRFDNFATYVVESLDGDSEK